MAVIATWSGDGLANGTVVTTSTAGTGDNPFNVVSGTGGNVLVSNSGTRPPRIQIPALTGQTKFVGWGSAVIGSHTSYAARWYTEITSYSSAAFSIARGLSLGSMVWRVDVAGTGGSPPGEVRLRNGAVALLDDSGALGLALNTVYRFEAIVTGAVMTLNIYVGESLIPWDTLSGTVGAAIDQIEFGTVVSGTTALFYYDDLAFSDQAVAIGPVAPAGPAWTMWNGTAEVPITLDGTWNGAAIDPATFDEVQ